MRIIKEPKDIDFIIESKPWTEKELADFRMLMKKMKALSLSKKVPFKKRKKHLA